MQTIIHWNEGPPPVAMSHEGRTTFLVRAVTSNNGEVIGRVDRANNTLYVVVSSKLEELWIPFKDVRFWAEYYPVR